MQGLKKVITYTRPDRFKIYLLGDIHAGCKQSAEDEIRRKIKEISQEENSYWIGMGDYIECITPLDVRWDGGGISSWVIPDDIVESQVEWAVETFKPIKDKCLAFLTGNHEDKVRTRMQQDPYSHIIKGLGLEYGGYSAFLKLTFQRENSEESHEIIGALTHGAGTARTPGGRLNRLLAFMASFQADFYGYAHTHDLQIIPPQFLYLDSKERIRQGTKVGCLTGSWVKAYMQDVPPGYVERAGYPPARLGCVIIEYSPNTGRLMAREEPQ